MSPEENEAIRARIEAFCTSTSGMSMCTNERGHSGPHHDDLSGRSW